jgi:hypothetical protein
MKILITSDSHDRWDYLGKAVKKGTEAGCEVMLFAGDLVTPSGIKTLEEFPGEVHMILGNNEGEIVGLTRIVDTKPNIILHHDFGESTMELEIDGLKFYMNHYPSYVLNAAKTGKYDVCIYGHDHEYHEEKLENGTLLLNPGEITINKTGTSTCMLFDTKTKSVEKIILS